MAAESRDELLSSDRTGPVTLAVRWLETRSEATFAYLLLLPTFLVLGVVAFWPLVRTFEMSLHADAVFGSELIGEYVGLKHYVALLTGQAQVYLTRPFLPTVVWNAQFPFVHEIRKPFQSALTVTVVFTVVTVAFETVIGFGQALVLDQDFTGRRWARVAIIIPWAVPIVIQGMIFYLLFQPGIGPLIGTGQNPTVFQTVGPFSSSPLSNSVDSLLIVMVADIWKTSAFMALLILAGLQSVDRSLYDVAKVAGASPWQRFKLITFPLVLPSVLVAMLFRTIAAMRVFGVIQTISSCSVVPSLSCLVYTSFSNRLYGTSAAVAFLTALLIGALVTVYIVNYARNEGGGA